MTIASHLTLDERSHCGLCLAHALGSASTVSNDHGTQELGRRHRWLAEAPVALPCRTGPLCVDLLCRKGWAASRRRGRFDGLLVLEPLNRKAAPESPDHLRAHLDPEMLRQERRLLRHREVVPVFGADLA